MTEKNAMCRRVDDRHALHKSNRSGFYAFRFRSLAWQELLGQMHRGTFAQSTAQT